ncbi:MAG TPA: iron-containing alcohol dehydrogenase [Bryobacteraceae bacterium]|nr:iron-containing alcohol dehydrogenase [Bryobacteraceae bacterium]
MVGPFEFATATRIVFGPGTIQSLASLAEPLGARALVVTGANSSRAASALAGFEASYFSLTGEPTLAMVREGVKAARGCQFVIGFGGGSAMDAAKAIAALAPNSGEPLDYLEVIGQGRPLEHAPLPFLMVPTTAGTGAEVTRNAVLGSPEHRVKASLRSPLLVAKVALIDPDLTLDAPAAITASTGLDTLTQLIEPFVSCRANALTDVFCLEGLRLAADTLPKVFRNGRDRDARTAMAFASLLSGLSLSNAGLGIVHGFAGPLGGLLKAPHGALCAAVLPHGMAANIRALRERAPNHDALDKYRRIAQLLTGDSQAEPEDAVRYVSNLCQSLGISSLRVYGLEPSGISDLVAKVAGASSTKANPIQLARSELVEIAERAL